MTFVYLDTETTGLDPNRHHIWEIGWAVNDDPVHSVVVEHSLIGANAQALEVGQYWLRGTGLGQGWKAFNAEDNLLDALAGATVVGANPAFDTAFLTARWGKSPWNYRLLDIEAYAMGALGFDVPCGLNTISKALRDDHGFNIPLPDHTAAGDVAATRACHLALLGMYDK